MKLQKALDEQTEQAQANLQAALVSQKEAMLEVPCGDGTLIAS